MKQIKLIKSTVTIAGIFALALLILFSSSCSSDNTKETKPGAAASDKTAEKKGQKRFHCPMHPTYTSDKNDGCPICGMDLVPIPDSKKDVSSGKGTKGLAAVTVSQENIKRLGLTFGTIELKPFQKEIRTSARIIADETRMQRVTARIDGWVEKLFVNVTGQNVSKGSPLLTIYSPELVAAQQELLTALTMVDQFKDGDYQVLSKQGKNMLEAARLRLKLWEISDKQIEQIIKNKQVQKTITLYAPASGVVSEKTVLQGQKIMAGEPLMVITDLSHVWGMADIYEADVAYVKLGTSIEIHLPNQPEKTFSGKISFLEPGLDPTTRTLKARVDILNTGMNLKPEMYADAIIKIDLGEKLSIPVNAVMRSGERDYAFVVGKEDRLLPVEVKIGPRFGDFYEMVTGLYEGDLFVTSANFLIDSESSIKAALEAVTNN